ncbi:hypothetical protein MBLNU457_g0898t1 [Dothideomycetes sp. NU457]
MTMSPTSVFRAGANALITGGGSGVGLAVAKLCASHSMNVILVDWNESALSSAQQTLSQSSKSSVSTHKLDVSSLSDWQKLSSQLASENKTLDFLHLNAGIGGKSDWTDNAYFRSIFETNFFGVVNGVNTFYKHFKETTGEHKAIVITGSKQGITNPPGNPAYNASKAAIKSLAEGLSWDMAKDGANTSVHLLVPGWTFTGLTGGGATKEKPAGAWSPEQVAEYLYEKMGKDKFYIICPDNDVDTETDKKRMMWSVGDIVYERQPLSRWRDEYKEESKKAMDAMKL